MSGKKSNWLIILVIALIVLQITTLLRIGQINNEVRNLENRISNIDSSTLNGISNLNYTIEQQLAEQASIIDSYEYSFGEVGQEALTVALNFTVSPKELTADTTATLVLADKSTLMERSGDSFLATVEVSLFDSLQPPRVIFDNGNTRQQETIDVGLDPRYEALPQLQAWLDRAGGSTIHKAGENGTSIYYLDGTVQIDIIGKASANSSSNDLSNLRLAATVNEKEVWRLLEKDFPDSDTSGGRSDGASIFLTIPEPVEFSLEPGQTVTVYAAAEDAYGLTHQVILDQVTLDKNGEPNWDNFDWFTGEETLLDKDGNILWQPEY